MLDEYPEETLGTRAKQKKDSQRERLFPLKKREERRVTGIEEAASLNRSKIVIDKALTYKAFGQPFHHIHCKRLANLSQIMCKKVFPNKRSPRAFPH